MGYLRKPSWPIWLAIGLLLGVIMGGLWPDRPLHAVATDRADSFAMATGPVDEDVEAVYFLDFATGTLRAAVLSNQQPRFQALYQANVNIDLAQYVRMRNAGLAQMNAQRRKKGLPPLPQADMPAAPSYMMVTGMADIRRGAAARMRPALSSVYVAETTTGILLAYIIPWDPGAHAADQFVTGPLTPRAIDQFTIALVQTQVE